MNRKLAWTHESWPDYLYWQTQDRKSLKRINKLITDIKRSPFEGIDKPEALKQNLSGFWSRRIDDTNSQRIIGGFAAQESPSNTASDDMVVI